MKTIKRVSHTFCVGIPGFRSLKIPVCLAGPNVLLSPEAFMVRAPGSRLVVFSSDSMWRRFTDVDVVTEPTSMIIATLALQH